MQVLFFITVSIFCPEKNAYVFVQYAQNISVSKSMLHDPGPDSIHPFLIFPFYSCKHLKQHYTLHRALLKNHYEQWQVDFNSHSGRIIIDSTYMSFNPLS